MTTFNTPGFACLAALLALALLPGTAAAEPLVTAPKAATDIEAAELKSKLEAGIARAFLSGMSENDGALVSSQAEMPSGLGDPLAENLISKMFVRLATKASAELALMDSATLDADIANAFAAGLPKLEQATARMAGIARNSSLAQADPEQVVTYRLMVDYVTSELAALTEDAVVQENPPEQ